MRYEKSDPKCLLGIEWAVEFECLRNDSWHNKVLRGMNCKVFVWIIFRCGGYLMTYKENNLTVYSATSFATVD